MIYYELLKELPSYGVGDWFRAVRTDDGGRMWIKHGDDEPVASYLADLLEIRASTNLYKFWFKEIKS